MLRRLPLTILLLAYLGAWAAPFLSPYPPHLQFREFFYSPPTRLHWRDPAGHWHWRPFILDYRRLDLFPHYQELPRVLPVSFFVRGAPYRWMGIRFRRHLFGLTGTDRRLFLMGSDSLGRDLFSRVLYGARFSLSVGLAAVFLTLLVGAGAGTVAGYAGGWTDRVIMRLADLFLSLPVIFLILAIRALFPMRLTADKIFWVMVCVFALAGWAVVTRVTRGQVQSLRERGWVEAARVAGASHWRILRHHILPFTSDYLMVQATVLLPSFILSEITLSFLGVGVQEPDASWGTLLASAASIRSFEDFPWMLTPAFFVLLTVAAFNLAGEQWKMEDREIRRWW